MTIRALSHRSAPLVTLAALLAVSGCSKSPEDFKPTPVPDGDRITDAASLEGSRWELGSEKQLLGEDDGYFEFCTSSPGSNRVVTTVVLRDDGFVDTEKECEEVGVTLPDIDDYLNPGPGPKVTDGKQSGLTWELDDDGWLRFANDSGYRCEADGVAEMEFQMICFGSEDTVFERNYRKVA